MFGVLFCAAAGDFFDAVGHKTAEKREFSPPAAQNLQNGHKQIEKMPICDRGFGVCYRCKLPICKKMQIRKEVRRKNMEKRSIQEIICILLKAVTLAMGVAVVVLSCLEVLEPKTGVTLLGIGLACAGIAMQEKPKTEKTRQGGKQDAEN